MRDRGYLMTGSDLLLDGGRDRWWPLAREPLPLKSSCPGVFVDDNVRYGSVKRVAPAVGEGAMAVKLVHRYLALERGDAPDSETATPLRLPDSLGAAWSPASSRTQRGMLCWRPWYRRSSIQRRRPRLSCASRPPAQRRGISAAPPLSLVPPTLGHRQQMLATPVACSPRMSYGPRLGKYRLLRKLATGGMAEVFLAKTAGPMGFEKQLVIKRILPHLAEDPQFVQMFLGEAKLAAQLNHPNLVQIFDFGESDGSYFIAMEYIDGPTVRLLLQRARDQALAVPFVLAARIVSAAAEGLAYAHEFMDEATDQPLQLVHRDVSPDNILISRSGSVKVVDFGIAKARGVSHLTQTGTIKGKVAYMAPEQLQGEVLDQRVDLYGLGVVLYELLTLNMPYEASSDAGLVRKVLYDPYVPAAERRPELPLALQQALTQLLAKNRDDRYSNCRMLQADLERYIHATGETASGYALAQLVARLAPSTPVAAQLTEPEMPVFTPSALGAAEPSPVVFPLDAPGVDGDAKTVARARARRTSPEGFVFPGALESERAPVRHGSSLGSEFTSTDLHGSSVQTDPNRDAVRKRSAWPLVLVLFALALVAGAWLVWTRVLAPEQAAPVTTPTVSPPPAQPIPPPEPAATAKPAQPPAPPVASTPPVPVPAPAKAAATPKVPTPPSAPTPTAKKEPAVSDKLLGAFEAAQAQAPKDGTVEETGAASVRFESTPPLRVRIGERILGTTPLVVHMPTPGPVDVELFDTGQGLTRLEHVELAAGDNGVRTITFEKGAIDFQLQPGISVYVDGKKLGEAPFDKPVQLYEGKHPVRFVLGDQEERRLVTVVPGETETLEFSFER
jgi:eukaryotic-like serine/threonine-protein kinase